jgi:hypothetical protein
MTCLSSSVLQLSKEILKPRQFQIEKEEEGGPIGLQCYHHSLQWNVTVPLLDEKPIFSRSQKCRMLFHQDNNFEAGNPDDIEINDDLQIDILLYDMLNRTQDQDNYGHSQLDTPTLY